MAALRNNRKFVGIDAEKEYLDRIAIPRIKDVFNQNGLFSFNTKDELKVSEKQAEYGLLP